MKIGSSVVFNGNSLGLSNDVVYCIIEIDLQGRFIKVDNYDDVWYNIQYFTESCSKDIFFNALLKSIESWQHELSKGKDSAKYKHITNDMLSFLSDSKRYI